LIIKETDFGAPPEELFGGLLDRPGGFLLDSARPAGGLGAFSFIGIDPFLTFRSKGNAITLENAGGVRTLAGDPLEELRRLFQRHRQPRVEGGLPFTGGAVGYFSYELCSLLERVPRRGPDPLPIPDIEFGFYDGVLAFDHATGRSYCVAGPAGGRDPATVLRALEAAVRRAGRGGPTAMIAPPSAGPPGSNFSRESYLDAIRRIKEYIRSGDVYQVNLSQRFDAPLPCAPYELYRRLRRRSPAPFAAHLNFGPLQIASSSPERFLRIQGSRVETRPIKGTRRRGAGPDEDARLAAELLASEKDRAELLMIVDLERNDLGRVCETGSVSVDEIFRLESHPTVHHLVASVSGALRTGCDVFDCIRAMFPGGSITGAPKVRAMQIIDEIETCRRHVYTGALGYLGFDGNCDLNVAIRTVTCLGGRAYYPAGGGVVWDSDPEAEYQESLDKARAMHAALTE
jgi:para-aminobenzoate synthetase component 1